VISSASASSQEAPVKLEPLSVKTSEGTSLLAANLEKVAVMYGLCLCYFWTVHYGHFHCGLLFDSFFLFYA